MLGCRGMIAAVNAAIKRKSDKGNSAVHYMCKKKNQVNCLGACNIALSESTKFDESRPCRVCDKGHIVAAGNTCVCNHGYRGPCCGGRPFFFPFNQF